MPAGRCSKPTMQVDNLIPGHEYKFRVKAVNPEGESEPLDGEHSIIAKNPFGKWLHAPPHLPYTLFLCTENSGRKTVQALLSVEVR